MARQEIEDDMLTKTKTKMLVLPFVNARFDKEVDLADRHAFTFVFFDQDKAGMTEHGAVMIRGSASLAGENTLSAWSSWFLNLVANAVGVCQSELLCGRWRL